MRKRRNKQRQGEEKVAVRRLQLIIISDKNPVVRICCKGAIGINAGNESEGMYVCVSCVGGVGVDELIVVCGGCFFFLSSLLPG